MLTFFILGLTIMTCANAHELKINFDKLRNSEGTIKYLVFSGSSGFPDDPEKAVKQGSFETTK